MHVARLAGLPAEVLDEATRVLHFLEQQHTTPVAPATAATNGVRAAPDATALTQQLVALDICQMTPLQALTLLHQLHQQARGLWPNGRPAV